jgi:hypothetical protein
VTVENSGVNKTTYTIAAAREPAAKLYLRHPKAYGYKAVDLPAGTVEQPDAYLVAVALAPAKLSEVVIEEHQSRRRTLSLLSSDPKELTVYIQGSHLVPALDAMVKAAFAVGGELTLVELELDRLRARQSDVHNRGYELRDNIEALANVKTAADLKKKLVASLAENIAESEKLSRDIVAQNEIEAAARTRLSEAIREISLAEPQ